MPRVSLIIRVKNEERFLPQVLDQLVAQTFKDFEVIIVDDHSTDNTVEIAKSYQSKLSVSIFELPKPFNYAYACNFGAEKASGEIIGYLSGHSVPIFIDYLESGLKCFNNPKVAGVYGTVLPLSNASWFEKIYYSSGMPTASRRKIIERSSHELIRKPRVGLLGNTNSLLRKSLWEEYCFQETMSAGGEDVDWAFHFLRKGYVFVKDPRMTVMHSHGIGFVAFVSQLKHWMRVDKLARRRNGY